MSPGTRRLRTILSRSVLGIWAVVATSLAVSAASTVHNDALARSVVAVGMTVSDLDRSVAFFSDVLSFSKVTEAEVSGEAYEHLQGLFGVRMRVARMRLGDEEIELTEYLTPRGRPIPFDARSNDRSFQHIAIVVSDMARAYQHLRTHKVQHASTGPQTLPAWNKNAAGISAFYFKDPDNHSLEILQFPSDKGLDKWRRAGGGLFLGIDHTAIVVADTEASLGFYRDVLGMRVVGESENYGTEQEHLNNVFGARLRITALRAPAGPGVEFLEYVTPRDGQPMPMDVRTNDLVHWETMIATGDVARAETRLRGGRFGFVSPGAVTMPDERLGIRKGLLVRDPDGHAVKLVEHQEPRTAN